MGRAPAARSLAFGLLVAIAVVLYANRRFRAPVPPPPPPAPALSAEDLRAYLVVKPEVDRILRETATRFDTARPDETLGEEAIARVDALLREHGLTRQEWSAICRRVELRAGG